MGSPSVLLVDAPGLAPYVSGLRALEAGMTYPIAGGADSFRIDHGSDYHPFFSGLGRAWFLVALADGKVVGTLALVARKARIGAQSAKTLYLADYKIAPEHRGSPLARKLGTRAARACLGPGDLRGFSWAYFAAMQGEKGDVTRSARRLSPLGAFRPLAELLVYFEPPSRLASLDTKDAPPPPRGEGLDLSPSAGGADDPLLSTAGRKDLVLSSSGKPWPLVHFPCGPSRWGRSLGDYLARSGELLSKRGGDSIACFAVDERLEDQTAWLEARGIRAGARSKVYALSCPPWRRKPDWVHLSTGEI